MLEFSQHFLPERWSRKTVDAVGRKSMAEWSEGRGLAKDWHCNCYYDARWRKCQKSYGKEKRGKGFLDFESDGNSIFEMSLAEELFNSSDYDSSEIDA
jgi:hypothetical protein